MIIYEAFNGGKNSRECKRPIKEPGRTRRPFERPLIVDTLDLSDRNLRLARVQRGRARAITGDLVTGRGGDQARPFRDRWSASATNGNSTRASYVRVSTRVNSRVKSRVDTGR